MDATTLAPMTVIETPQFIRTSSSLTDDERSNLIAYLAENPEAGALIVGTGGVRKLRFAREGGGKSSGYRVIYYFHSENIPLFLLHMYGKNKKANLSQAEKNAMKMLTKELGKYGEKS